MLRTSSSYQLPKVVLSVYPPTRNLRKPKFSTVVTNSSIFRHFILAWTHRGLHVLAFRLMTPMVPLTSVGKTLSALIELILLHCFSWVHLLFCFVFKGGLVQGPGGVCIEGQATRSWLLHVVSRSAFLLHLPFLLKHWVIVLEGSVLRDVQGYFWTPPSCVGCAVLGPTALWFYYQ